MARPRLWSLAGEKVPISGTGGANSKAEGVQYYSTVIVICAVRFGGQSLVGKPTRYETTASRQRQSWSQLLDGDKRALSSHRACFDLSAAPEMIKNQVLDPHHASLPPAQQAALVPCRLPGIGPSPRRTSKQPTFVHTKCKQSGPFSGPAGGFLLYLVGFFLSSRRRCTTHFEVSFVPYSAGDGDDLWLPLTATFLYNQ